MVFNMFISGGASILWFIIWVMLVRNSPVKDQLISKAEKEYLRCVNPHISDEKVISSSND